MLHRITARSSFTALAIVLAPLPALADDMGNMTLEEHMKMMEHQQHETSASEHVHHEHGKGSWMFEYRYMRMNMSGLMNGSKSFSTQDVLNAGYAGASDAMTMDMHMLMAMYGLTDKTSLMAMFNYQSSTMPMVDGMGNKVDMKLAGVSDPEIGVMYKLNKLWLLSLGLSLPVGAVNAEADMPDGMGGVMKDHVPYDMQLGSGTLDFKPAATYQRDLGAYNVGAQATYTYHMGYNKMDYRLGDRLDGSVWVKYNVMPVMQVSGRLAGHYIGKTDAKASSHFTEMYDGVAMMPMAPDYDPKNTGSARIDALIGVNGMYKRYMGGLEIGMPAYQRVRGIQLKTGAMVAVSVQALF